MNNAINEIILLGCTPTPLANYLKALGVLRLLSVRDPQVKGAWQGEVFVLWTLLSREVVEDFLLNEYRPTPVMAPWNGGSGFYFQEQKSKEKNPLTGKKEKLGVRNQATSATKAVDALLESGSSRLELYRSMLSLGKDIVKRFNLEKAPSNGMEKDNFIKSLRSVLPDGGLDWLDASLLVTAEQTLFPPLLGTGGNDGNLDFTTNFMQRLMDLMDADTGCAKPNSPGWLRASLFAEAVPALMKNAIGQFFPGQAGGPNASTGFEADSTMNPWDFVFMVEGALSFAATAVRRNADEPSGVLSYPFTVRAVGAGAGNIAGSDAADARGELWMPLWAQPASYAEVRTLLSEGRVAVGKRPARDALDFVRAVHQLGGYRGVQRFQRFGLLMRSGKAYLATPLERVEVTDAPEANLLDELMRGDWFDRFRRFAQGDSVSNSIRAFRERLETTFFRLSGKALSPAELQAVLILLGEVQSALCSSKKAREASPSVLPMPRLSDRWVQMADDKTPAFRIACAQAAVRDLKADKPSGNVGARLDDVLAFMRDDAMDARIAALLPGLSLCEIPKDIERETGEGAVPAAFALMKLCLIPDNILRHLNLLANDQQIPLPSGMLAQLVAGNASNRAVRAAWRRLRASGLAPAFSINALPTLGGLNPRRVAKALMIPLRLGATAALARRVLAQPDIRGSQSFELQTEAG